MAAFMRSEREEEREGEEEEGGGGRGEQVGEQVVLFHVGRSIRAVMNQTAVCDAGDSGSS